MEDMIYIGKGIHIIAIRNRNNNQVDVVKTNINGLLKYTFVNDGVYDLICRDRPELSKFAWEVASKVGAIGVYPYLFGKLS